MKMSKLSESIGRGFTLTTELMPPRGADIKGFVEYVARVRSLSGITAVNVIDSPSARLHMSSLGASVMLLQNGLEPIYQMVCRDRNCLALQSDLLSASAFGIENVLALTGDHPARGASDHPFTKPVYDLDSTSLIAAIKKLNMSRDIIGRTLTGATSFTIGAAVSPTIDPAEPEALKVERKLAAGAQFFQSQAVFQSADIESFMAIVEETLPEMRKKVLVGIIPLSSMRMIGFLNGLPGIIVPEKIAARVKDAKDPQEEGVAVSTEIIDEIKSVGFGGAHIMPVGHLDSLEKILSAL